MGDAPASPVPLGMAGLAIASLVLTGYDLGWGGADAQGALVGALVLATGAALQGSAAVLAFAARDAAAGTTLGVLASGWAALGLTHLLLAPGAVSGALGLLLLAAGGLALLSASVVVRSKPLPGIATGLGGSRFVLTGVYHLSGVAGWQDAAGWLGLAVVAAAAAAGYAVETGRDWSLATGRRRRR